MTGTVISALNAVFHLTLTAPLGRYCSAPRFYRMEDLEYSHSS